MREHGVDIDCSFIVGGQIDHHTPRLFRIYPEGNFIEATPTPTFFQIGETKYGKPIIDRVVRSTTPLKEVAKAFLVSFDSTMRSNLTVGLPIDLLAYERDALQGDAAAALRAGRHVLLRRSAASGRRGCAARSPKCRSPWVDEGSAAERG